MLACPPAQWTSIAYDSTVEAPKLTASPIYIATKWESTMTACSDVGLATMVDEAEQPLTLAQVVAMTFPDPSSLAQVADPVVEAGEGADGNAASSAQDFAALSNKVDEVSALTFVLLLWQACRALLGAQTESGDCPRFA